MTFKCRSKVHVGQGHSSSNSSNAMVGCITGSNVVKEIGSYRANKILHCDIEMQVKGRPRSLIFELIQGDGGMHHWVKFCVNR